MPDKLSENKAVPSCGELESQIAENLRYYGKARFEQLTLFMGGITVIAAGLVHEKAADPFVAGCSLRAILAVFGILFTSVIWVMEIRSTIYWTIHWSCARHVWPLPATPRFEWLTASSVVAGLYLATYCALLFCVKEWGAPVWLLCLLGAMMLVILGFMVWMYLRLQRLFNRYRPEQVDLK